MFSRICIVTVLVLLGCCQGKDLRKPAPPEKTWPGPSASAPRKVVATINVPNGGGWGKWHHEQYCPNNSFAVSFNLKVQPYQGIEEDDTALNAFWLKCAYPNGTMAKGDGITSELGPWGEWTGEKPCKNAGLQYFLTRFKLRVEEPQGVLDDTAANNVIFSCRPLDGEDTGSYEQQGIGAPWGEYGVASKHCPTGAAICGLRTKIEAPVDLFMDDTALNDVEFYCCNYN